MNHADKAAECVLGDRNADYGNPHEDFAGIALMWSGLLNTKLKERITATDVALMMSALKLRRHAHKAKDDNLIDCIGYVLCLQWIETGERPAPETERLNAIIAGLHETIEDVATGGHLTCTVCNKTKPCGCDHGGP